jgi:radical SAM superfamily enzyme YgiQ (UPF0313 family)
MRYTGKVYRPPSEANSYILQATIGCSWNNCTYCDMYRDKPVFRQRPLAESLEDIAMAGMEYGQSVEKVFVADGDALIMPMHHWRPILRSLADTFSGLRSVSCYATATNILEKTEAELVELVSLGLGLLYIGPESGDEITMRRIAKGPRPKGASRSEGYLFDTHVAAAEKAKAAGFKISTIFLLGAGGVERSEAHAHGSAKLVTAMDPNFLSALTLTVVPNTPLHRTQENSGWVLPEVPQLLGELRIIVAQARPTNALFRTNHASNYLPLAGRLPKDRQRIVDTLDLALSGEIPLRPEWSRGL